MSFLLYIEVRKKLNIFTLFVFCLCTKNNSIPINIFLETRAQSLHLKFSIHNLLNPAMPPGKGRHTSQLECVWADSIQPKAHIVCKMWTNTATMCFLNWSSVCIEFVRLHLFQLLALLWRWCSTLLVCHGLDYEFEVILESLPGVFIWIKASLMIHKFLRGLHLWRTHNCYKAHSFCYLLSVSMIQKFKLPFQSQGIMPVDYTIPFNN